MAPLKKGLTNAIDRADKAQQSKRKQWRKDNSQRLDLQREKPDK